MDNKVLEVALQAYMDGWCKSVEGTKRCIATWDDETDVAHARAGVRAALLASLPVLLGEPVAYWVPNARVCSDGSYEDGPGALAHTADASEYEKQIGQPLYAPSLGEGDGR